MSAPIVEFLVTGRDKGADPALTSEAVEDFCRNSTDLASFKRPRRIIFVENLPINPSGKVQKRELISSYSQEAA